MSRLRRAIVTTFERRKTLLPDGRPTALTDEFLADRAKVTSWKAFLKRVLLPEDFAELKEVGEAIAGFLLPVIEAARTQNNEESEWSPKGPWNAAQRP
jgi:hypothetical protein